MSYKSILYKAIEENEKIQKKNKKKNVEDDMFQIIKKFINENGLVCYGGIAINAILPKDKQFYDESIDIPDYDFFSPNALEHAKQLAKIFALNHYENVEAKSAVSIGTYKVFVNFIPVADITQLDEEVFLKIQKNATLKDDVYYAPDTYLRMSLYQELSRPYGDISRWEKIYNRLTLLNETKPFFYEVNLNQNHIIYNDENDKIYKQLTTLCQKNEFVVFGDYGLSFYKLFFPSKYIKQIDEYKIKQIYVLIPDVNELLKQLDKTTINYKVIKYEKEYKFLNSFYEIQINEHSFMYVFQTNSCQSYNKIKYKNKFYNIATIDTILSIYYALEYIDVSTLHIPTLLSYCYLLEQIHSNNKTNVLRRFHLPCIGTQETIEDIRKDKNKKYKLYRKNKTSKEYQKYFFKYIPKTRKKT